MPADFRTQHFELTASSTTDFDIVADLGGIAVDPDYTVVTVPNMLHCSTGRAVVDTSGLSNLQLSARFTLRDSGATIRVTLDASHEANEHVYFVQLVEYIGVAGGDNEWVVRGGGGLRMTAGVTTNSVAIAGVTDTSKLVPFCAGVANTLATQAWSHVATTLTVSGSNIVGVRGGSSGVTTIQVQGVELTGSNWSVQQNLAHLFTAAGVPETFTLSSPVQSWGSAFALCYHKIQAAQNALDEISYSAYARATDKTRMVVQLDAGADLVGSGYALAAHVVYNPLLQVYHGDADVPGNLMQRLTDSQSDELRTPIGLNAPLSESWLIPRGRTQGGTTGYPGAHWGCMLVARSTIRFRRGRTIAAGLVTSPTLQAIRMPRSDAPTSHWLRGEARGAAGEGVGSGAGGLGIAAGGGGEGEGR